jgi:hypothetical protein
MDKEDIPVSTPQTNTAEDVLKNGADNKQPEIKQTNASPSKLFMLICGIIAGILFWPLALTGLSWVAFLGLVTLLIVTKSMRFFWGAILVIILPPLLFFGSCFLAPFASMR